jgi:hypothetical protein
MLALESIKMPLPAKIGPWDFNFYVTGPFLPPRSTLSSSAEDHLSSSLALVAGDTSSRHFPHGTYDEYWR